MIPATFPPWRQIDAGIWRNTTDWGHWEITFSSAPGGRPTFELVAFDEHSATLMPPNWNPVFDSLDTARSFAEANRPSLEALRAA